MLSTIQCGVCYRLVGGCDPRCVGRLERESEQARIVAIIEAKRKEWGGVVGGCRYDTANQLLGAIVREVEAPPHA